MNQDKILIGFDFSMAKPAMCIYINGKIEFYTWPMNIDKATEDKLKNSNINVFNRQLEPIDKKKYDSNTLVMEHIKRATYLSDIIINDLKKLFNENNLTDEYITNNVIVSSEGLSFASRGDVMLDLSGYKYILLHELHKTLGIKNIKTYSPITIKSVAGAAKKGNLGKTPMIDKFMEENPNSHKFLYDMINNPDSLKKKTAFVHTVDDLVDSYWCLKTLIEKENLNIYF